METSKGSRRSSRRQGGNGGNIRSARRRNRRRGALRGEVQVAAAYGMVQGPKSIPDIKSNGVFTRVKHSEMLFPVVSSGAAFNVQSLLINAGLGTLPWLSAVGARYEAYKFRSVIFRFVTSSIATNPGLIIVAFDFDAMDPAPADQFSASSYRDHVSGPVWKNCSMALDLVQGDKSRDKKTRVGLPATPYDLKTYDVGQLHVCLEGVGAGTVGKIDVEYVVDLFTPQIQLPVGGKSSATAGLDATHLFGTTITVDAQANLPGVYTSSQVFTFTQAWEGYLSFYIVGTGLAADWAPVISASGASTGGPQAVNAATSNVVGGCRIKAVPGTTLTPTITATTVTQADYRWGDAAYVALA